MKYFVDFEATQFAGEIISIGCVREDGKTFYSLVAPSKLNKVTEFITKLTGLTVGMLENAPSADKVFEEFYDWTFDGVDDMPEFYAWGNADIEYLRHTFHNTTSMKARTMMGYMCGDMRNAAKWFSKRTKIKDCALIRAYNLLIDNATIQTHNALDDAMMLAKVVKITDSISVEELREKMGIKKVKEVVPSVKWTEAEFPAGTVCIVNKKKAVTNHFDSLQAAAEWLITTKVHTKQQDTINENNIAQKIKRACLNGKPYFSCKWRLIA